MKYGIFLTLIVAVLSHPAIAADTTGAVAGTPNQPSALRPVSLVYINDVHAQLEPHAELFWSKGEEEFVRGAGGISRIATVFNRMRAERPGEIFFIDGGDTIQGSGPAAWSEGKVVVDPMNALGLDLAIPGNWSVAYGAEAWKQRTAEFNYSMVAANMFDSATGEPLFPPYVVRVINGVRIGFIGFTEPEIPSRQPPHLSDGLAFGGTELLPPLIAELREHHKVEVVVLVTHIGLPKAIGLADTLEGVDVILSADTHERTYEPVVRGDTWVVEAGAFGSFVGVLDLRVDEQGKIAERKWRLIELRPEVFPEDPEVKQIVQKALAPHRPRMDRVIGHTDIWLARYDVMNTAMDALIANALHATTGADIALSNGYRFAAPTAPGPLTEGDLWNWLPMPLELKRGEASGRQLREYWEHELENVLSKDPNRLFGGWLPRVSGMNVEFQMRAPAGQRVERLTVGERDLEDDRWYTITAGNRRGAPADSIHRVHGCKLAKPLGITTHDAVEQYLRLHSPIRSTEAFSLQCTDDPGVLRSQILENLELENLNQEL